jgi:hypothetical protein
MNSDQIKAHAAGFLHALAVNPDLAARWQGDLSNDQRATMLAAHLGLAQTPSVSDLQAMAKYASDNLPDAVAKATPGGKTTLMVLLTQS